jgi:uncharacterized lipoprotein YddW (UPF0748 family)
MIKMKFKNKIPLIISILALIATVAFSSLKDKNITIEKKAVKTSSVKIEKEMRGVWVSFMELDMENTDRSYKSFKNKFRKIADNCKKKKFNTLIVQVRPYSDALYNSKYYPFSHIISGVQGKKAGYDPLKYMCAYTHKIGLSIHAWINPYRVRSSNELKLSKDNPYIKNKSLGVKVGKGIYYNPALPKVRKLIENGIKEIIYNYDVDGIQFDDYFYPTTKESFDRKQYLQYKAEVGENNAVSLKYWRMSNVNILIAECYSIIHNNNKRIVFGISPQGNIENDYEMCADVYAWCSKSGYVDYICPQLYYSLNNPALKFSKALKNWTSIKFSDDVNLYIGIAGYKAGTDADNGTWKNSDNILKQQVELIRKNNLNGFMFYSYKNLNDKICSEEINNLTDYLE